MKPFFGAYGVIKYSTCNLVTAFKNKVNVMVRNEFFVIK